MTRKGAVTGSDYDRLIAFFLLWIGNDNSHPRRRDVHGLLDRCRRCREAANKGADEAADPDIAR
jgi:hypothetical protein